MPEEYPIKRRFPRFTVLGKVEGKIVATLEATLVNLSLGGALIEHSSMVRPGSLSQLVLPTGTGDLRIACRVVRSSLSRRESRGNETVVVYQTGLEFVNPPSDTLAALERVLALAHPGGGTSGEITVTLFVEDSPIPPA